MPKRSVARSKRVLVNMTPDEWKSISATAAATGLSASALFRNLALGYEPPSVYDHDAVLALAKVAGDQGRLGGLLKLWLSQSPGEGAREIDVARVLRDIEQLIPTIRQKLERL